MTGLDFASTQKLLADHLRFPENKNLRSTSPLNNIEERRLKIYRELIFNNIEGFISSGFPILKSLYDDGAWKGMVRDFIQRHESHTPYFLEISQEFLAYLQNERDLSNDPPFILELAHYEWVELALDVSNEVFPHGLRQEFVSLDDKPVLSPLAWNLSYQYPVHHIGTEYQPQEPPDVPTFLVVYRNRDDDVKFMEGNAPTSRLLTLLDDGSLSVREALSVLAEEMQAPDVDAIFQFGEDLIKRLLALGIVAGYQ
ncbi:DUF2063 domain-containing protein [Aurantivibrio plasticivorans]